MKLRQPFSVECTDSVGADALLVREATDRRGIFRGGGLLLLLLFIQQVSSADPIGDVLSTATKRYMSPDLTESERRDVYRDLYMELTEAVAAAGESSRGYEDAVTQRAIFALMGGLYEEAAEGYDELFALGIDEKSSPRVKEAFVLNASVAYLGAGRLDDAASAWNRSWGNMLSDNALTDSERRDTVTISRRWLKVGSEMGRPLEVCLGPLADFYSSRYLWDQFDVDGERYILFSLAGTLRTLEEVISDGRGFLLPGLIEDATELREFFELRENWDPKAAEELERICAFAWPPETAGLFGEVYPPLTTQNINNLVTAESPEDYCRETASQLRDMMSELAFPAVAVVRVLKLAAQVVRIGLLSPDESAEFAEALMAYRIRQGTVNEFAEREAAGLMLNIESALREDAAVLESVADQIRNQEVGASR